MMYSIHLVDVNRVYCNLYKLQYIIMSFWRHWQERKKLVYPYHVNLSTCLCKGEVVAQFTSRIAYRRTAVSSFPRAVLVTSMIGIAFLPVAQF